MRYSPFQTRNAAPALKQRADGELLSYFLANHNEGAFAALIERYGQMVWNVCWQVLHHQQDAEAAWQQTFIVLIRKAESLLNSETLKNWLRGVALHEARNVQKKKRRRGNHECSCEECRSAQVAQPIDGLAFREERTVIDAEVQRLPEEIRTCFILHRLERRSKREVAQALGLKEGTVASRVRRASRLLESRLAAYGILAPVKPNGKRFGVRRRQP